MAISNVNLYVDIRNFFEFTGCLFTIHGSKRKRCSMEQRHYLVSLISKSFVNLFNKSFSWIQAKNTKLFLTKRQSLSQISSLFKVGKVQFGAFLSMAGCSRLYMQVYTCFSCQRTVSLHKGNTIFMSNMVKVCLYQYLLHILFLALLRSTNDWHLRCSTYTDLRSSCYWFKYMCTSLGPVVQSSIAIIV